MNLKNYITDRICHLKKHEMEYFDMSCDQQHPWFLKDQYRRFSNEFMARRQELEQLLNNILQSENAESVTNDPEKFACFDLEAYGPDGQCSKQCDDCRNIICNLL